MADGAEDERVGQTLGGSYRLERLIQRGGMGAVYEAVQEPLGRRVAIKVLHEHLADDEVTVERFRREAEATARLLHPHIVQVTDYRAEAGEPAFLVMEYLGGRSLAEVMREDGILPPERAVHIAVQVLDGLAAAHEAGVVHRDLKPTNILLASSAGLRDVVTIVDFGVAKLVETAAGSQRLTAEGALVGTPAYMAPEQARGLEVDGRTDIYALGVLLYAMLAGRLPFASKDPGAALRAIVNDTPTPLLELRPDLDPDLVEVVARALAREPDDRWPTADAMRRELQRWLRRAESFGESVAPAATPAATAAKGDAVHVEPGIGAHRTVKAWVLLVAVVAAGIAGSAVTVALRPPPERILVREPAPAAAHPLAAEPADAGPRADVPAPTRLAGDAASGMAAAGPPAGEGRAPRPALRDARRIERDASVPRPRLRVHGAARAALYDATALEPKFAALTEDLRRCVDGQSIPPGGAPPIWHLDVTAEGTVRTVQPSIGEWPLGAANCVTRGLTGLELGPTRTGAAGQLVITFGPE